MSMIQKRGNLEIETMYFPFPNTQNYEAVSHWVYRTFHSVVTGVSALRFQQMKDSELSMDVDLPMHEKRVFDELTKHQPQRVYFQGKFHGHRVAIGVNLSTYIVGVVVQRNGLFNEQELLRELQLLE